MFSSIRFVLLVGLLMLAIAPPALRAEQPAKYEPNWKSLDCGMGMSYGYNRNEPLSNYRSEKELIWMLVDLVSRGGNLLLDVGPRPTDVSPRLCRIACSRWAAGSRSTVK